MGKERQMEETPVDLTKMSQEELIAYAQKLEKEKADQETVVTDLTTQLESSSQKLKEADVKPTVKVDKKNYTILLTGESTFMHKGVRAIITAEKIEKDPALAKALVEKKVQYLVEEK